MTSGLLAVVLPRWMRYICFCVDVLLHMHSVPSLDLFFCGLFLPCISEEMKLCPFHSVLNTFSLRADLSCVLIWVVGLKSLQVSWKNRWLGRWEQESLFALLLLLASQLNPLVIGLWEDVCPSFRLLLLADLSSAPVGYFFYPGLSEKKGGAIFWISGVPQQSEELWGDALLSLRASLSTGIEDVRFRYAD